MCKPDNMREFVLFDQIEQMTTKELNAVLEKQHLRITELEDELTKTKGHSDDLAVFNREYQEIQRALVEALENLENDNGAIPEHAWLMVQKALEQVKEKADDNL